MQNKKNKANVEIAGEAYALKGDIEPERIKEVAKLLDIRMKQTAKLNPGLSKARIAILAALNIADDYLRLEKDYKQIMKMMEESR